MSAIALKWVATLHVGNQTAKQLLQFYASHNFNKPGFEFKNSTLALQLEVSERAIRDAHKLLINKKLISRVPQYGKDGSQLSTMTYLEIPNEFVDNFFKREGGEELAAGGGGTSCHPREELAATLNSNINNKKNKREAVGKKRPLLLPPDFESSKANIDLCKGRGLDPNIVIGKFISDMRSKGIRRIDWQAALTKWILDEKIKKSAHEANTQKNEAYAAVNKQEFHVSDPEWTKKYQEGINNGKINTTRREISGNHARGNAVRDAKSYLF